MALELVGHCLADGCEWAVEGTQDVVLRAVNKHAKQHPTVTRLKVPGPEPADAYLEGPDE